MKKKSNKKQTNIKEEESKEKILTTHKSKEE